ncbi:Regulator of G-protein signaling 14 [Geranomyces michiganensis]|nr:Regulator of G-protein signaling 14 [Geranomyces michiganensis]
MRSGHGSRELLQQQQQQQQRDSEYSDDSSERRVRIARVMSKQQQRISVHVQLFSKITVAVAGTDVVLTVTINRSDTIEELSKLIEAEYAYLFFMQEDEAAAAAAAAGKNDSGSSRDVAAQQKQKSKRDPLVIGQMYDAGQLALKYEDRVGDVLGFTDRVSVINAFEGESVNRALNVDGGNEAYAAPLTEPGIFGRNASTSGDLLLDDSGSGSGGVSGSDASLLRSNTDEIRPLTQRSDHTAASGGSASGSASQASLRTAKTSVGSLDDRLQSCLRNKLALRYFSEACAEEYTIENLLFWLDVEVFQSLPSSQRQMYGQYIYLTYVSCSAPLQINIPAEIRNDIQWPLDPHHVAETIFDEAQEQVYAMLKNHSFLRFEKGNKYKQYLEARSSDHNSFMQSRIAGPFANYFQANIETARAVIPMLEKSAAHTESLSNRKAAKEGEKVATIKFRESMLSRTVVQYFPLANRIMDGYFNETNRSSWGNKQKRMHKEKKLAKFFGERPSVELIQRQIAQASAGYLRTETSSGGAGGGGGGSRDSYDETDIIALVAGRERARAAAHGGLGSGGGGVNEDNEAEDGDATGDDPTSQIARRRKKEKLEEFFGDKLPKHQRIVQQLMVSAGGDEFSAGDPEESAARDEELNTDSDSDTNFVVETTNELDPEERRMLQRRHKKLASVLGETPDEKTIGKRVTLAALQEKMITVHGGSTDVYDSPSSSVSGSMTVGSRKPSDAGAPPSGSGFRRPSIIPAHMRGGDMNESSGALTGSGGTPSSSDAASRSRAITRGGGGGGPAGGAHDEDATSPSDADGGDDSKLAHKRRLDKISSLMGHRIGVGEIIEARANVNPNLQPAVPSRPLTLEEKKLFQKKSTKLERMLGQLPPVEAIMQSLPGNVKPEVERVRKSLVGLQFLVKNAKDVVEILDAVREISDVKSDASGESTTPVIPSVVGGAGDGSKESRQKKLNKLRKFFGDKISVEMVVESQLLADLERSLQDVTQDENELSLLRAEVRSLRDEVRRRSDEFRLDGIIGDPGDDDNAEYFMNPDFLDDDGGVRNRGASTTSGERRGGRPSYVAATKTSSSSRSSELVPRSVGSSDNDSTEKADAAGAGESRAKLLGAGSGN